MRVLTSIAFIVFGLFCLFSCKKKDEMKTGYYNAVVITHRNSSSDSVEYYTTIGPFQFESGNLTFRFNDQTYPSQFIFSSNDLHIERFYQDFYSGKYNIISSSKSVDNFTATVVPDFISDTSSMELNFNFVE